MEQKYLDYLAQLGPIMPADVKPVHVGWYARSYRDGAEPWDYSRDYWDGENWFTGWQDGTREDEPTETKLPWRGLAEPTISAPAIADAMMDDAASLEPVDVVTVGPNGATRSQDAKVVPQRQEDAPDAFTEDWMAEYSVFDELRPWQVFAIVVGVILVLAGFSWLVK